MYPPTILPEGLVEKLYAEGLSQREIGERLGYGQSLIARYMSRHGLARRPKGKRQQKKGAESPYWAGDQASYTTYHRRVEIARGKPSLCSKCQTTEGRFEWANLTGQYHDVNDYARLCKHCHRLFDAHRRKETGLTTRDMQPVKVPHVIKTRPKRDKLNPDQVREIRRTTGVRTGPDLAREFGVSTQTISAVRTGVIWKNIQP